MGYDALQYAVHAIAPDVDLVAALGPCGLYSFLIDFLGRTGDVFFESGLCHEIFLGLGSTFLIIISLFLNAALKLDQRNEGREDPRYNFPRYGLSLCSFNE